MQAADAADKLMLITDAERPLQSEAMKFPLIKISNWFSEMDDRF